MEQYNQKSNPWAVDRKSIITLAPNTMSQCKCIKICFLMYLYNMVRNLHQKRTKSCARCDLWARGQGQQNEDRGSTTPTLCCWHRWRHCLTTAMWHKSTEGRESATQHVSLHGARHHNVSNSGAAAAANQCWHIQQYKASCYTLQLWQIFEMERLQHFFNTHHYAYRWHLAIWIYNQK